MFLAHLQTQCYVYALASYHYHKEPSMTHTIHGRTITFQPTTEFLVQTGTKGGFYRNLRRIFGDLVKAEEIYNNITLKPNMKKRLLMPTSSYPTIVQESK